MNVCRLFGLFAIASCLSACSANDSRLVDLKKSLAESEGKRTAIELQLKGLTERVVSLEQANQWHDILAKIDGIALLTPGADGYSVIKTDLGYLTISLADVQPYANGARVTLQFGNPTAASINGATATLEWGKFDPKGKMLSEDLKSRDVTFANPFAAGSWTSETVVLEGIAPSELGFVRVKNLGHTGMSLRRG